MKAVLAVAGALVVAVGATVLLYSPLLSARHLVVTGEGAMPVSSIEAAARITTSTPLVDVSPGLDAARIERLPWVLSASVTRHWPDTVVIHLTRRVAVATMRDGAGGYAILDRTGRVIGTAPGAPAGLPLLLASSGVPAPGGYVDAAARSGLEVAGMIPPVLAGQVRSIGVSAGGSISLVLTSGVDATLGSPSDLEAKFESLASVLAGARPGPGQDVDVSVPGEPTVSSMSGQRSPG
jgi:cell division protein FtsQ